MFGLKSQLFVIFVSHYSKISFPAPFLLKNLFVPMAPVFSLVPESEKKNVLTLTLMILLLKLSMTVITSAESDGESV